MIKHIYSIRDVKLSIFNLPFYSDSAIMATRQVKMSMLTSPDLLLVRFPSDYELYELGTYEDICGTLTMHDTRKFICHIKTLAEEIEQEKVWREVISDQTRQLAQESAERRKEKENEKN